MATTFTITIPGLTTEMLADITRALELEAGGFVFEKMTITAEATR